MAKTVMVALTERQTIALQIALSCYLEDCIAQSGTRAEKRMIQHISAQVDSARLQPSRIDGGAV